MIKGSFIILLITLSALHAKSQNVVVLEASKDAYLNTVIPKKYQGHVQSIIAAGWTYGGEYGKGRSLLGFELCPLPDSFALVSATLHLYHDYSAGHTGHTNSGLNSDKLYKTTSYWDESTTWSTQPSYDSGTYASISSSSTTTQNYSIDVTEVVNSCIASSTEIGFYLKLNQEETYRSLVFASRDHPDPEVRPKLELVYYTDDTSWCDSPPVPSPASFSVSSPIDNLEDCLNELTVPNVFSPNGDYVNDYFEIEVKCQSSFFHIVILNRWGNIVYESNDYNFNWNGRNKSGTTELSEGTYFYRIMISNSEYEVSKSGSITLVR
ncbi:MAG: DNRLRE domain-containing protein [Flavobacteriales bacterium]|nr:DNRLRE domain-containing protein [Flavobacteriales bacterium]